MMRVGDRVNTPHGVGTIKEIKAHRGFKTYGVLHDIFPKQFSIGFFTNNILYYFDREITKLEE